MKFGRRFGNYFGHDEAAAIMADVDVDAPAARVLSWTPTRAGAVFVLMLDKAEFYRGTETSVDGVPQDVRDHIEVFECSPQNQDERLERFASSPLDRTELAWDEATGEPDLYELYRSLTSGVYDDQAIAVVPAGDGNYVFTDGPLEDDVYYYRLTVYDAAGNPQNSVEVDLEVSAAPEPPSDLVLEYDDDTDTATLTWTGSTSGDLNHYAIYYGDTVVLSESPQTTADGTTKEIVLTGLTGHYDFLVRAVDGDDQEEANLSQMVRLDIAAGDEVARPNEPDLLLLVAIVDGQARATVRYDRAGEAAAATDINLYANDGAGGAVDWNTPVGTATLKSGLGSQVVEVDSEGLAT